MAVYRRLDAVTAKPGPEVMSALPHVLIDLVEPGETFDVAQWLEAAAREEEIASGAGTTPLYVGGTGLYLRALTRGFSDAVGRDEDFRRRLHRMAQTEGTAGLHARLAAADPAEAAVIHPNDEKRLVRALEILETSGRLASERRGGWNDGGTDHRIVGLRWDRDVLAERIETRSREDADRILEEVEAVRAGGGFGLTAAKAAGVPEALAVLDGTLPREDFSGALAQSVRRLARRQRTWWRSFPEIEWIERSPGDDAEDVVRRAAELLLLP